MIARFAAQIALLVVWTGLGVSGQTQLTNRISDTLTDFLSREGLRDVETGAILAVRPKVPRFFENPPLDCSIAKLSKTGKAKQVSQFEIVLSYLQMTGTVVHERIVLDAEPALELELSRQTKYKNLASQREKQQRDAKIKRITELSKGTLRYGMKKEEAVAAKGGNWKDGEPYQKAGAFEIRYDDMTLMFDPLLEDVWLPGGPTTEGTRQKPVPLNLFVERVRPSSSK